MIDLEAERARLDQAIARAEADLRRVAAKLSNPSFLERAPKEVVDKEKAKRAELDDVLARLRQQRSML